MPCWVATVLLRLNIIELWSNEVAESIITLLKLLAFDIIIDGAVPVEKVQFKIY